MEYTRIKKKIKIWNTTRLIYQDGSKQNGIYKEGSNRINIIGWNIKGWK